MTFIFKRSIVFGVFLELFGVVFELFIRLLKAEKATFRYSQMVYFAKVNLAAKEIVEYFFLFFIVKI